MRAIVHDKYGSFDVLDVRDIDKPVVKDDEVLVRVHAAGLHVGDCFGVRGAPFAMRAALRTYPWTRPSVSADPLS